MGDAAADTTVEPIDPNDRFPECRSTWGTENGTEAEKATVKDYENEFLTDTINRYYVCYYQRYY